jgi:hypothetical protein
MTDNNKELEVLDKNQVSQNTKKIVRQAGWGKGIFSNMADDFDNIPIGFENYIPNLKRPISKQK